MLSIFLAYLLKKKKEKPVSKGSKYLNIYS